MLCEAMNIETTDAKKVPKRVRKRGRVTNLPPCSICGEKASGLHYGVNSCEACKAFFYRNFKRASILTCDADDDCQPETGLGFKCPSCRMKRCLSLDMSLSDIKKGRYTYERRAHLKQAIKKHNETDVMLPERNTSPDSTTGHLGGKLELSVYSSSTDDGACLPAVDGVSSSVTLPSIECGPMQETEGHRLSEESIGEIITNLNDLYERYPQYTAEYFEKVKSVQKEFLERTHAENEVFGPLSLLPIQEFSDIFHKTGMDVDGRLESLKSLYPVCEEAVSKYVLYAQELPGFDKLRKEDQVSLLKGAKTSFWFICDYPSADIENGLVTFQNYETVTEEIIARFTSEEYARSTFLLFKKLKQYDFSQDEANVMRAYMILNPEYCVTEEGIQIVQEQRSILHQVLQHLIGRRSVEPKWQEELESLEKEMQRVNEDDTIHFMFIHSFYDPLLALQNQNEPIRIPLTKALYQLPGE